jgi:hypothetical protein
MNEQMFSKMKEQYSMEAETASVSKGRIWTSRILWALAILFLLMDGIMKISKPPFVVQATKQLGYPESTIIGIGAVLVLSTLLYAIPRTAVLGAILLTGYLGGAVASNVRAQTPLFNIVFPLIFACLIWASLVLRNRRLEAVLFRGE